ncbi:MAG: indolepyruvate ferredoxin oxidoreductase subunit alpha [Calditrichaeota bacterium]|nr:MAG: indolepyruvate ferredoxin oxidoreductase subunit alpha [Calditrichota bacterium]
MKHVGLNVASDALMTAAYTGVNAGMVFISADDPGMHSSQNEQDNRIFARFAQIMMLEPASSQEAKDYTQSAFMLSEQFDTPVMLRMTTRICHGKGIVELYDRSAIEAKEYVKNPHKFVMIPANARLRHVVVKERFRAMCEYVENSPLNLVEENDPDIGVISSGVCYQYARESFPTASFLKLGITHPLPMKKIAQFIKSHQTVYVVEELEPFIEEQIRAAGLQVIGKQALPSIGELSVEILNEKLHGKALPHKGVDSLPGRPPVMCAGCPHRAVFNVLRKYRAVISGDIGCYTLSTLPPLNSMDSVLCMGASIGMAQGYVRAFKEDKSRRVVSVLGDSTFIHSGIPSLVNAVYNRTRLTIVILDNSITAMTGHQDNPGSGKTLAGDHVEPLNFENLARAIGAGFVRTVDPIETESLDQVIREAMEFEGVSVVIAKRPCVLVEPNQFPGIMKIDKELCTECRICLRVGCPSISLHDQQVTIDPNLCFGCSLCKQVCPQDAIQRIV